MKFSVQIFFSFLVFFKVHRILPLNCVISWLNTRTKVLRSNSLSRSDFQCHLWLDNLCRITEAPCLKKHFLFSETTHQGSSTIICENSYWKKPNSETGHFGDFKIIVENPFNRFRNPTSVCCSFWSSDKPQVFVWKSC